ncbi:MAG: hypothetical protein ABIB71_04120 [Candidatus Woesearchaeota archaeon]
MGLWKELESLCFESKLSNKHYSILKKGGWTSLALGILAILFFSHFIGAILLLSGLGIVLFHWLFKRKGS